MENITCRNLANFWNKKSKETQIQRNTFTIYLLHETVKSIEDKVLTL